MPISIRPSIPSDAPGIVELLTTAGLNPNVEPAALEWKYWMERGDWTGPRSFVAERDAQILAHAAVVPGRCATQSRRVTVLHLIDWAARADSTGLGASLMKHIGRMADMLLAIGGSAEAQRIMPHIGYKACGTAEGYVRVLRPLRYLNSAGTVAWKLPARIMRRSLWRLTSPVSKPPGWRIRRIYSEGLAHLQGALPCGGSELAVFERPEALFRHVLRCPIVPMELYSLEDKSQVRGYFLLAFAPGQARLADCWATPDEPAAWQALLQFAALQACQHRDVSELVAWSSDAGMSRALAAGGFRRRNQQPIAFRSSPAHAPFVERVRVQMLDNDAAFLHAGVAESWA